MRTLAFIVFLGFVLSLQAQPRYRSLVTIMSSEPAHFIVTHPSGLRSGADPRGIPGDTLYRVTFIMEIPKANYAFAGTDEEDAHEFTFDPCSPDDDGTYSIQVIGTRLSLFWMDIHVYQDTGATHYRFVKFFVDDVIEKDSTKVYELLINGGPGGQVDLTKHVDLNTFAQDLSCLTKLKKIPEERTVTKYQQLIDSCKLQQPKQGKDASRLFLRRIIQETVSDSLSSLPLEACRLIRGDAEALLRRP